MDEEDTEDWGVIAYSFYPDKPSSYKTAPPIFSVIEDARKGALIKDVVSFASAGYPNVVGLRPWLLEHPRGLKP